MPRRKHRRVHHPRTNCKCPEGTIRKVSTCPKTGAGGSSSTQCKGRNMGCIKMVQLPGYARPVPRFVSPECGPEAGPVEQWKPKNKGYRKKAKKRPGDRERGDQLWLFPANEPRRTPLPMRNETYDDLPFTY